MSPSPGGRYELGDLIAVGGLGEVYRAWDRQLQRKVALKRIVSGGPAAGEAYTRALNEATHLAALQHPHIVTVYDFGNDDRGPYVVMELVEGETLEAVAARAAFPQSDFVKLAREALDGLSAAHAIGLLHRDLKPGNLMLKWGATSGFQVKLLDFGLAKISEKPTLQTRLVDNSVFGSVHYMAPEQFEGKVFDQRTDLYALGCLFYYALTRQSPFTGETVAAVMSAHLSHQFTKLELLRPDLDLGLVRWVTKFFELRPDDRHQSASSAAADLERVMAPKPAPAPAPAPPPPTAPPPPAQTPIARVKVVATAFGLGVLFTLLWFWLIQPMLHSRPSEEDAPVVRKPRSEAAVVATPAPSPAASQSEPPGLAEILRPDEAKRPIEATDLTALRGKLGQVVTVEGVIVAVNTNRKGDVRILQFGADYRTSLSLAFGQADVRKDIPNLEKMRAQYLNKRVRAEGTLTDYQGSLRLLIDSMRQLQEAK
ncbi:MAG: serine/threonine protein kinase [Verrucomicrobia bacterium]|nr:serine/threonine protein kinase [Verrucomicrobiota bacterium]